MKKQLLFLMLSILCSTALFAQPGGENARSKKDKIEDLKIAFITKELMLTSEEAQKFWPVYNEMEDKVRKEKKKQKQISRSIKENEETLSEAEFEKKSMEFMASGVREAELRKDYHSKIAGTIGYKKATKLLSLEQRFKRELLNRLNEGQRKSGNHPAGGPRADD